MRVNLHRDDIRDLVRELKVIAEREDKYDHNKPWSYKGFFDWFEYNAYRLCDRRIADRRKVTGWIYPPVRFDPVNFGTVSMGGKPCHHTFTGHKNGVSYGSERVLDKYCRDCGEKL